MNQLFVFSRWTLSVPKLLNSDRWIRFEQLKYFVIAIAELAFYPLSNNLQNVIKPYLRYNLANGKI